MKILSTSIEIQKNIFNQMSPEVLFLMSQCSLSTKEAIKSLIVWTQPLEVIAWFSGTKAASPTEQDKVTRVNFGIVSTRKKWNIFEMELKAEKTEKFEDLQFLNFDIDGLMVSGNSTFDESGKMTLFIEDFENKLNQIHLYMCQLFQTTFDLFVQLYSLEEYKLFFPHSIKKSALYNKTNREIGWKNLDEFFEYHSTQYMSTIVNPRINSRAMNASQKFTGVLNLLLINVRKDFYRIMENFEGDHLVMHQAHSQPSSIVSFVNSWKNGKHNTLKSIISFNAGDWNFNTKQVLDQLKPGKWNKDKRPRHFEYDSIIHKYQRFKREVFDCADGWDVTRQTDGAIATAKIHQRYFMFFVWPLSV